MKDHLLFQLKSMVLSINIVWSKKRFRNNMTVCKWSRGFNLGVNYHFISLGPADKNDDILHTRWVNLSYPVMCYKKESAFLSVHWGIRTAITNILLNVKVNECTCLFFHCRDQLQLIWKAFDFFSYSRYGFRASVDADKCAAFPISFSLHKI